MARRPTRCTTCPSPSCWRAAPARIVLCDTGFMREGTGEAMSIKFDVPYWISPLRMLAEMGVAADDVTDIVLSHAHFDHMGSIGKFPKARLHIQKREILSWHEAMALPPRVRLPDRDHQSRRPAPRFRRRGRAPPQSRRRRRRRPSARAPRPARRGPHDGPAVHHPRDARAAASSCRAIASTRSRNICGHDHSGVYVPLTNAIGAAWDQLKTIDRINKAIKGDLDRLSSCTMRSAGKAGRSSRRSKASASCARPETFGSLVLADIGGLFCVCRG